MNKEERYLDIKSSFNITKEIRIPYCNMLIFSQIQGVPIACNHCYVKVTNSSFKEPVYIYYIKVGEPKNSVLQIDIDGMPRKEVGVDVSGCRDLKITVEIVNNDPQTNYAEFQLLYRWA